MSRPFEVGDVVFVEGNSGLLCDVIAVEVDEWNPEQQKVTLHWRPAETEESSEDLVLVSPAGGQRAIDKLINHEGGQ